MTEFAAGESRIDSSTVRTSLVFFWLRTSLTLTNKRLMGTVPNTMLAVFPVGRREMTQPLDRISNVGYDAKFYLVRFLIGVVLLLGSIGLLTDGDTFASGFLFLVIAVLVLGWSWVARITVTDNSGKANDIPVSMLDKEEINRFLGVVNRTLAEGHHTATTSHQQAGTTTNPGPDRIEQLQRITALRESGALTEDEFQAEKRKILDS